MKTDAPGGHGSSFTPHGRSSGPTRPHKHARRCPCPRRDWRGGPLSPLQPVGAVRRSTSDRPSCSARSSDTVRGLSRGSRREDLRSLGERWHVLGVRGVPTGGRVRQPTIGGADVPSDHRCLHPPHWELAADAPQVLGLEPYEPGPQGRCAGSASSPHDQPGGQRTRCRRRAPRGRGRLRR